MSGNIRNIKIRLNLDKPEAMQANKILNRRDKSMSQFVIAAVNAYGNYLAKEEADERFLQSVNNSLRETIQGLFGAALIGAASEKIPQPRPQEESMEEASAEIAEDFLKNFV